MAYCEWHIYFRPLFIMSLCQPQLLSRSFFWAGMIHNHAQTLAHWLKWEAGRPILKLVMPQQLIMLIGPGCVEHRVKHLELYSFLLNKYSEKEEQESCTGTKLQRTNKETLFYSLLSSSPHHTPISVSRTKHVPFTLLRLFLEPFSHLGFFSFSLFIKFCLIFQFSAQRHSLRNLLPSSQNDINHFHPWNPVML